MKIKQASKKKKIAHIIEVCWREGNLVYPSHFSILQPIKPTPVTSSVASAGGSGGPTVPARHKLSMRRHSMRGYASMANHYSSAHHNHSAVPPGKVLISKEGMVLVMGSEGIYIIIMCGHCN